MIELTEAEQNDCEVRDKLEQVEQASQIPAYNGGLELDAYEENFIDSIRRRVARGRQLTDKQLAMLRKIWDNSSGNVDLILVNGFQKRKINSFTADSRTYAPSDTKFANMISIYESDFGICSIITSRQMPQDTILFLDSSRVNVLPLSGRSFHFKPLASSGDYECGELIGEYTLELKNEAAHGLIRDLATS